METNGDYSVKKFKSYLPITMKTAVQTKPIIKTVVNITEFSSAHGPVSNKNIRCVNTAGDLCANAISIQNVTWKNACLHHYRFKTIEEFVLQKMIRLWPTHYFPQGRSFQLAWKDGERRSLGGGVLVNTDIAKAITEAQIFIEQQAEQNKYGDITVTITLNDGVPVKLTKVFCEHFVRRKTTKLAAN